MCEIVNLTNQKCSLANINPSYYIEANTNHDAMQAVESGITNIHECLGKGVSVYKPRVVFVAIQEI